MSTGVGAAQASKPLPSERAATNNFFNLIDFQASFCFLDLDTHWKINGFIGNMSELNRHLTPNQSSNFLVQGL